MSGSADLANQAPRDTFGRLLQIANGNEGLDSTLRPVLDGKGEASQLRLSTNATDVQGPFTAQTIAASGNIAGTVTATGSTTPRALADRAADWANVLDFGADFTGATDSTTAIRNAIATGKHVWLPAGAYRITDMITAEPGQIVQGDARTRTRFLVSAASFNMSALGVLRPSASEPGSAFIDVGIEFDQPTAPGTVRANLNQYPAAIYAQDTPRFVLHNVRWTRAWNGLDMRGNAGGAYIGRVEDCSFNIGLQIGGALDFVHIESWHNWPFGASTSPLIDIWSDGNTQALVTSGVIDGLAITKFATFQGRVTCGHTETNIPAIIQAMQLDGNGARLVHTSGRTQIGQLYSTKAAPSANSVAVSGGLLDVGSASIVGSETVAQIAVTGGQCRIHGGEILHNAASPAAATVSAGLLLLRGITFRWPGTRTQPLVAQSGTGVLRMMNCVPGDTGSPTGPAISLATDVAGAYVDARPFAPHTISLPAAIANGQYFTPPIRNNSPTITAVSGAFTTVSGVLDYAVRGRRMQVRAQVDVTTNGTAASGVVIAMPFNATALCVASGRNISSGQQVQGLFDTSSQLTVWQFNNAHPVASGQQMIVEGEVSV